MSKAAEFKRLLQNRGFASGLSQSNSNAYPKDARSSNIPMSPPPQNPPMMSSRGSTTDDAMLIPPSPPPNDTLWRRAIDKKGRIYYFHTTTRETSWNAPEDLTEEDVPLVLTEEQRRQPHLLFHPHAIASTPDGLWAEDHPTLKYEPSSYSFHTPKELARLEGDADVPELQLSHDDDNTTPDSNTPTNVHSGVAASSVVPMSTADLTREIAQCAAAAAEVLEEAAQVEGELDVLHSVREGQRLPAVAYEAQVTPYQEHPQRQLADGYGDGVGVGDVYPHSGVEDEREDMDGSAIEESQEVEPAGYVDEYGYHAHAHPAQQYDAVYGADAAYDGDAVYGEDAAYGNGVAEYGDGGDADVGYGANAFEEDVAEEQYPLHGDYTADGDAAYHGDVGYDADAAYGVAAQEEEQEEAVYAEEYVEEQRVAEEDAFMGYAYDPYGSDSEELDAHAHAHGATDAGTGTGAGVGVAGVIGNSGKNTYSGVPVGYISARRVHRQWEERDRARAEQQQQQLRAEKRARVLGMPTPAPVVPDDDADAEAEEQYRSRPSSPSAPARVVGAALPTPVTIVRPKTKPKAAAPREQRVDKLYQEAFQRQQRRESVRQQLQRAEEEEYQRTHTFQPLKLADNEINEDPAAPKRRLLAPKVTARVLQLRQEKERREREEQERECTFTPQLSNRSKKLAKNRPNFFSGRGNCLSPTRLSAQRQAETLQALNTSTTNGPGTGMGAGDGARGKGMSTSRYMRTSTGTNPAPTIAATTHPANTNAKPVYAEPVLPVEPPRPPLSPATNQYLRQNVFDRVSTTYTAAAINMASAPASPRSPQAASKGRAGTRKAGQPGSPVAGHARTRSGFALREDADGISAPYEAHADDGGAHDDNSRVPVDNFDDYDADAAAVGVTDADLATLDAEIAHIVNHLHVPSPHTPHTPQHPSNVSVQSMASTDGLDMDAFLQLHHTPRRADGKQGFAAMQAQASAGSGSGSANASGGAVGAVAATPAQPQAAQFTHLLDASLNMPPAVASAALELIPAAELTGVTVSASPSIDVTAHAHAPAPRDAPLSARGTGPSRLMQPSRFPPALLIDDEESRYPDADSPEMARQLSSSRSRARATSPFGSSSTANRSRPPSSVRSSSRLRDDIHPHPHAHAHAHSHAHTSPIADTQLPLPRPLRDRASLSPPSARTYGDAGSRQALAPDAYSNEDYSYAHADAERVEAERGRERARAREDSLSRYYRPDASLHRSATRDTDSDQGSLDRLYDANDTFPNMYADSRDNSLSRVYNYMDASPPRHSRARTNSGSLTRDQDSERSHSRDLSQSRSGSRAGEVRSTRASRLREASVTRARDSSLSRDPFARSRSQSRDFRGLPRSRSSSRAPNGGHARSSSRSASRTRGGVAVARAPEDSLAGLYDDLLSDDHSHSFRQGSATHRAMASTRGRTRDSYSMNGYDMDATRDGLARSRSRSTSTAAFNSSSLRLESGVRHYADRADPDLLNPTPRFSEVVDRIERKASESQAKRQAKLRALAQQQKAVTNVTVSEESQKIFENSDKNGDFYDRLNISLFQRARAGDLAASKHQVYADHTFKPEINPYSKQMPRRSVQELSHGDLIRQKQVLQLKRIHKVRSELDGVTFTPQRIKNPSYEQQESALSLRNIESDYIDTVRMSEQEKRERSERAAREREEQALRECTFKPATAKMPKFIQEQAEAHRARMALEPRPTPKRERPDWK